MATRNRCVSVLFLHAALFLTTASFSKEKSEPLLRFPLQWKFLLPQHAIILTSDQQLQDLQNPDKEIDMSLGVQREFKSLRQIAEQASAQGCETVILAFDNFFRQYRKDAGDERKLLPDADEYIQKIKTISDFLAKYGLGLELSLLSPLELGSAFTNYSGESGRWVHYKVDLRDPQTGQFSVMLWEQLSWSNNKGKFHLKRGGVRAFAFKEKELAGGAFTAVHPEDIQEITSGVQIEEWPGTTSPQDRSFRSRRIRIHHPGDGAFKGYDRVFVILSYSSPEMDYFSPKAPTFLKELLDKYHRAGIRLNGLYSDEMHIQQDWGYFNHHDDGQFALRYLTQNMANEYARLYGSQFADMDKYMLYFFYGPKIFLNTTRASRNTQIVTGESPEDIHRTFLFRDRYYKLLNNRVVDLFLQAKDYAEKLYGHDLLTRAHASWAQSPTIDQWEVGKLRHANYQYEYTPNFIWSNTVHQAASACYDYFKWGDYLTGSGNDHAEGGWSDRDYYGAALACSYGILNKYPNAYAAHWGMPAAASERRQAIASAYGANATPTIKAVTENVHRDVEVLMLYPMNLVATEERFGSWMVQYGYANYITTEKLLEMGKVTQDGKIELAGRSFSSLASLFEILPQPGLLEMMDRLAQGGGRVIWSGPPPLIAADRRNCREQWEEIFGAQYQQSVHQGEMAAGKTVEFTNSLASVPEQMILTDFLVDRIYPVNKASEEIETVATVDHQIVGTKRKHGAGFAYYLGFRPRDDQAGSLGREARTWFEILSAAGAYPPSGKLAGINDNTEYLSRTTDYLTTRFPNGAVIVASHYKSHRESWPGGFARNAEEDERILQQNPLPSDSIHLRGFKVNGHEVDYSGRLILAFNVDEQNHLIGFEGHDCDRITIDGKEFVMSSQKQPQITWAQVAAARRIKGKAFLQIFLNGSGEISIPLETKKTQLQLWAEGSVPGSKGKSIPFKMEKEVLKINADRETNGRWIYLIGKEE